MAITTLDGYIASKKQIITYSRPGGIVTTATSRYSLYHLTGDPGAGVLAGTNAANGVLVTSTTPGFPLINVTTGNYYLSRFTSSNTVAGNIIVQDLLYKAGAFAFNVNSVLTAQPSISGRVPGTTDYTGVDIYFECVTAFTGIPTITVTYTNQSGLAARTTGAFSLGVAPIVAKLVKLPLQSGDTGVQKIESVQCTIATVGTFNIQLVRDLYVDRIPIANWTNTSGLDKVGLPEVYSTSALNILVQADSTVSGAPGGLLEIASA